MQLPYEVAPFYREEDGDMGGYGMVGTGQTGTERKVLWCGVAEAHSHL